ncbi:MAG: universal stress protein [Rhizobiaceae bacterium]
MNQQVTKEAPFGTTSILVPVDFTTDSEAALLWACRYAENLDVDVKVLHIVHDPGDAPGAYHQSEEDLMETMEEVAQDLMNKFLAKLRNKYPDLNALATAQFLLFKGIPATRILEVAEQYSVQHIVMGSRGRTGLPHLLLGSKAERVVQLSPVPVTIVKASYFGEKDD